MMPEFFDTLGAWSIPALWLPLAAWTVVGAAALALDARLPLRRPVVRQRVLVAVLFALPLGLTLRAITPLPLWPTSKSAVVDTTPDEVFDTTPLSPTRVPPTVAAPPAWTTQRVLGGLTAVLLLAAGGGLVWLIGQYVRLHRWLRRLPPATLPETTVRLADAACASAGGSLRLHFVEADVSPFACGLLRPLVVLPAALATDTAALRLAIAHEAAHVRSGDAWWHLLARTALALVPWHPVARALARAAELRREQAADAAVLASFPDARLRYAHLLVDVGTAPLPAAALAASPSQLKPRVSAMKHALDLRARGLVPALLLLVGLGATLSVRAQDAPEVFAVAEVQPTLVGGLESLQSQIHYPEIAKQAGIEGRVIVQFVVDKEGHVVNPTIVRGIGAGCDEEALRVVQQARFEPGRQRGLPVNVQMTLPIEFQLGAGEAHPTNNAPRAPNLFVVVEEMPTLVGGLESLQSQISYPEQARQAGVQGRVIVRFLVDERGVVQQPQIVRGVGAGLDEEALRVVQAARFTPGRQRGREVKVQMTLPVTFRLGPDGTAARTSTPAVRVIGLQRTAAAVTGTVLDASTGHPLVGANVFFEGTDLGTSTDPEGRFVFYNLPPAASALTVSSAGFNRITVPLSDVSLATTAVPEGYALAAAPNPSGGDVEIGFSVPVTGPARLEVFNAIGQRVAVLFDNEAVGGQPYRVSFDGAVRESGLYFYRLTHAAHMMTRTFTLTR